MDKSRCLPVLSLGQQTVEPWPMKHPGAPTQFERPVRYEIRVLGRLHERWSSSFGGMTVTVQETKGNPTTTLLSGPVVDQAALRSILCSAWDLNLTVVSVIRVDREHDH